MPHACVRVLALLRATAARKGHRRRRANAGLKRALTRNRRYLTLATTFAEKKLRGGGSVFLLDSGPSSVAFAAAWIIKHSYEPLPRGKPPGEEEDAREGADVDGAAGRSSRASLSDEDAGGAGGHTVGVEEAIARAREAHPGAPELGAALAQQIDDFHRGVALVRGPRKFYDQLPRLNFAPQFEQIIVEGKKAATTRMLACKKDKLGPVSVPGAVCVGTARGRDFGILVIRQCREMAFSDVDDELARMEDMSSASELQAVLRGFYPEIEDSDRVRVIVFSLLVSLPEGRKVHEDSVARLLEERRQAMSAHEVAEAIGLCICMYMYICVCIHTVTHSLSLSLSLSLSHTHTHTHTQGGRGARAGVEKGGEPRSVQAPERGQGGACWPWR